MNIPIRSTLSEAEFYFNAIHGLTPVLQPQLMLAQRQKAWMQSAEVAMVLHLQAYNQS